MGIALSEELIKRAKDVTDYIYAANRSSTGYLFGIPPEHDKAVEKIVGLALKINSEMKKD